MSALALQLVSSDIQSAVVWAQKLPVGTARQNAMSNIISQWSDADPQGAADFALRATEAEGRKALLENVSRQWARNDPSAALRWASSLPESNGREAVLPAIVAVGPRPGRTLCKATRRSERVGTARSPQADSRVPAADLAGAPPPLQVPPDLLGLCGAGDRVLRHTARRRSRGLAPAALQSAEPRGS